MNTKDSLKCATCLKPWEKVYTLTKDQRVAWGWEEYPSNAPKPKKKPARPRSKSARQRRKEQQEWEAWQQSWDWTGTRQDVPQPKDAPPPFVPFEHPVVPDAWRMPNSPFVQLQQPPIIPGAAASSSGSNPQASANAEVVKALKEAYADAVAMPPQVKELLEKFSSENSKSQIKELHQATTALGKAKKAQQELLEQRKVHRTNWLKHLEHSVAMWQKQLETYRIRQSEFQSAINRATSEVTSARTQILSLNAADAALKLQPMEEPEDADDTTEAEEIKLRKDLQTILQTCAEAVGPLNMDAAILNDLEAKEAQIEMKDDLHAPKQLKRAHGESAEGSGGM